MAADALRVIDERTGKEYRIAIADGTIRATDLRQIRTSPQDFGLLSYDPGLFNTAVCRSRITFVDGERGVLRYRGYAIEDLAEHATFEEVAYLVLYGDLLRAAGDARLLSSLATLKAEVQARQGFDELAEDLLGEARLTAGDVSDPHASDELRRRREEVRLLIKRVRGDAPAAAVAGTSNSGRPPTSTFSAPSSRQAAKPRSSRAAGHPLSSTVPST